MSIIQTIVGSGVSASAPIPALFDAASSGSGATGTTTWSHTISGSDTALLVGIATVNTLTTGVTYNGVPMNLLGMYGQYAIFPTTNTRITLYGLIAPTTGANNIIVTTADAEQATCASISYTGANQTAFGSWMSGNGTGGYGIIGITATTGDVGVGFAAADVVISEDLADVPPEVHRVDLADGGMYIWGEERISTFWSAQVGWNFAAGSRHWAGGGVAIHPA
jgi:hypothetical protein